MKNKDDKVSRSVFEQVQWERDMALSQLKDLGYGLGEKPRPSNDYFIKSGIVIRQLREDRDRLEQAIKNIKAEITVYIRTYEFIYDLERRDALYKALEIINKYTNFDEALTIAEKEE